MKQILARLAVALILLAGCNGEIREFEPVTYEKATVVGKFNLTKDSDELDFNTSDGVKAKVCLVSKTAVQIKFQDEKIERKIGSLNWINSTEIRFLAEKNLLFVKVVGSRLTTHNEWQNEQEIFVYNLSTRKLMGTAKI